MCGITGILSELLSSVEIDAFKDLMIFSTARGYEGAGVATLRAGKNANYTRIYKAVVTGAEFVTYPEFDHYVKENMKLLLGHTRWPTRGENKPEFCHPFRSGHIIGVHNGTMHKIDNEYPAWTVSDSAVFFEAVAKRGIIPIIKNSSGAYAFVWVDETKRTIWLANHKTLNTLMWASEPGFLDATIARRWSGNDDWTVELLPPDTLRIIGLKNVKVKEITDEELKPDVFQHHSYGIFHTLDHEEWEETLTKAQEKKKITPFPSTSQVCLPNSFSKYQNKQTTVSLIGPPKDNTTASSNNSISPNGMVAISLVGEDGIQVFENTRIVERLLNRGCMGCGNPSELKDLSSVMWLSKIDFMCTACQQNPDWKDFLPNKSKYHIM
jgi:hypothetical protein